MPQRTLFKVLVFLIPTQLSLHFWPEWAHVFGIRVDYLSPTIYLTDLLVLLLIILWAIDKLAKKRKKYLQARPAWVVGLVGLLLFVFANILIAQRPQIAFIKWLKIFEFFLIALYVAKESEFQAKEWMIKPLMYAAIFFSSIALLQFFYQRTLGGPLYFLGERSFSAGAPGIALFSFFGRQLLRPYSTFPHPNALAGFMLVSLILFLSVKWRGRRENFIKKMALFFASISLLLSVSRTAWIAGLIVVGIYFIVRKNNLLFKKATLFLLLLLVISSLLFPFFSRFLLMTSGNFGEGVIKRLQLAESAGKIISTRPLFGIGLGNFVVKLPAVSTAPAISWWLQPVHNIFLLLFAEVGALGLIIFLYLIIKSLDNCLRIGNRKLTIVLLAILLTGFLDHYWLTLQQNQLLYSLILGLSFRKAD